VMLLATVMLLAVTEPTVILPMDIDPEVTVPTVVKFRLLATTFPT
jgi:hypothetical protein